MANNSGRGRGSRYQPQGISFPGMPVSYPQYGAPQYPTGGNTWGQAMTNPNNPGYMQQQPYNPNQQYSGNPQQYQQYQQYNQNMYQQGVYQPAPQGYNNPHPNYQQQKVTKNLPRYNAPSGQPMKTQNRPSSDRTASAISHPDNPSVRNPPTEQRPAKKWIGAQRRPDGRRIDLSQSKKKKILKQAGNINFSDTIELNKFLHANDTVAADIKAKQAEAAIRRQQRAMGDQAKIDAERMREQIRKEESERLRKLEGKRRKEEEKRIAEERARLEAKLKQEELQRQKETEAMKKQLELYKKELAMKEQEAAQAKAAAQVAHQAATVTYRPHDATDRQKHVWEVKPEDVELSKELGKGAFGVVYSGRLHGKEVAIKKLFMQDTEEDLLLDFKNEVQVMNHLRHPNILLLMGACFRQGDLMIITELMPGGSVDDLIHKPKPGRKLSFPQRMKIARDSALGMNWLHSLRPQFLHLDLKSANLLVNIPIVSEDNMDFVVKVADFGLTTMKSHTAEGMVGSPFYMAPEMLLEKEYDEKVDVYSFSICLWELYTCKEPYKDMFSDLEELIEAITIDLERPALPDDTPKALKDLLTSCWADDPAQRPSFEEIVNSRAIEKIIIDHEITDKDGASFWKSVFVDKFYIYWDDFWKAFSSQFGILLSDADVQVKVLKVLLEDKQTQRISMASFNKLLAYFGPLKDGNAFMDNMNNIVSKAWFFGPLPTRDSETLLKNSKKKGTFLVRFSGSKIGCYTVSVAYKNGKVRHLRVTRTPDRKYYFDNKKYNSLPEFLSSCQKNLGLRVVCSGSPFVKIYSSTTESAEYNYGNYY